jgi:hypothetical protein
MSSPQYGTAYYRLIDNTGPVVLTPVEAGSAMATVWGSPEVRDIKVSCGGTITEVLGTNGQYGQIDVTAEYVDITFTILPNGTTKANALKAMTLCRKGTPFTVTGAPVIQVRGHEASALFSDVANSGTLGASPTMFLQSHDLDMSVEGKATGTITLRRYPGITSATPVA